MSSISHICIVSYHKSVININSLMGLCRPILTYWNRVQLVHCKCYLSLKDIKSSCQENILKSRDQNILVGLGLRKRLMAAICIILVI